MRRILQTGAQQPWQRATNNNSTQPHDADHPEEQQRKDYFSPNRWYCCETMCTPCGVVLAWTKFAKSESPSNILGWLKEVYPSQQDRPAYICIDKACLVMKTAVIQQTPWEEWKQTTRFIVDSYHYINHKATDRICRTWCNPSPQDGSAPNLVGERIDKDGNTVKVREFNTEACEQLNAWLGGFESILKRMTVNKFNWFLHVMIFYHVKHVLQKMEKPNLSNPTSSKPASSIPASQNTIEEEEVDGEGSDDNEDSDDDDSDDESDDSQILSNDEEEEEQDEEEDDETSESGETSGETSESEETNESGENEIGESGDNEISEIVEDKNSGSDNSDIHMHLSD